VTNQLIEKENSLSFHSRYRITTVFEDKEGDFFGKERKVLRTPEARTLLFSMAVIDIVSS